MQHLSDEFIKKVARSLQEEEVDIYVLTLYCRNSKDLEYFAEQDREKVKKIFNVLIEDTQRHAELLKLIVDLGAK